MFWSLIALATRELFLRALSLLSSRGCRSAGEQAPHPLLALGRCLVVPHPKMPPLQGSKCLPHQANPSTASTEWFNPQATPVAPVHDGISSLIQIPSTPGRQQAAAAAQICHPPSSPPQSCKRNLPVQSQPCDRSQKLDRFAGQMGALAGRWAPASCTSHRALSPVVRSVFSLAARSGFPKPLRKRGIRKAAGREVK